MLDERGIALRTGAQAIAAHDGVVELIGGDHVRADRVIALPHLVGPAIPGLPRAPRGSCPPMRTGACPASMMCTRPGM